MSDTGASSEKPAEVTAANWAKVEQRGFQLVTNLSWPLSSTTGDSESSSGVSYVDDLYRQFGAENVLIGWPQNHDGLPDESFHQGVGDLVGIYVNAPDSTQEQDD